MQYLKTICLAVGFLSLCATTLTAQDPYPTINPLATFTKSDGTTETGTEYSGSPLSRPFSRPTPSGPKDGPPTMNGVSPWRENLSPIWCAMRKTPK